MDLIKLSSRPTREYWGIPILFEDESLLVLDKPARLPAAPDKFTAGQPDLLSLLHREIARQAAWARQRGLTYLRDAHWLDAEATGILVLAKNPSAYIALNNAFTADQPRQTFVVLAQGAPPEPAFRLEAKLAPHPWQTGLMRVAPQRGKRSVTLFEVRERFARHTLLEARPLTHRRHQIRIHLRQAQLPVAGDPAYRGRPLLLSTLKSTYRLKPGKTEKPLLSRPALHAEQLAMPHPQTGELLRITAPWPKDLSVAVKYLRKFAPGRVRNDLGNPP